MEKDNERRDLFNMTGRKRAFMLGATIVILAAAVVIGVFINVPLTEETYYYTFSTIAQSIIALVAFLGAVVIFRIQLYENKKGVLAERMGVIILADPVLGKAAKTLTNDDIISFARIRVSENTKKPQLRRVAHMLKEIDAIDASSDTIKLRAIDFSIIAICNAIIAIVGLFLTPFLIALFVPNPYHLAIPQVPVGSVYLFFSMVFACMGLLYGLAVILEVFKSMAPKHWYKQELSPSEDNKNKH